MRVNQFLVIVIALLFGACSSSTSNDVLVLTATSGYPYASTEAGVQALVALDDASNFDVIHTSNPAYIHEDSLKSFKAVIFLHTQGDVLSFEQRAHLERFIQAGGGFVGIHAAIENDSEWRWYDELIGAEDGGYASDAFNIEEVTLSVIDGEHEATRHLSGEWMQSDRWLNVARASSDVKPLLTVTGTSSNGGQPVSWYHEFDGGRVFYTALGHEAEVFSNEQFLQHLEGGIQYVLGDRQRVDFSRAHTPRIIDESRFTRTVLVENLFEPTEFEVLDDGRVLFAQRRGNLMLLDPATGRLTEVARLDVNTKFEDGLMGLALDPNYDENHWIYLYYSPASTNPQASNEDYVPTTEESKQHLSRFVYENDQLDLNSEVVMLEVATQRVECCHTGGSIEFGPDGNLFLSTGDDINPFASNGYGPIDERSGRSPWDGQGTSANTNDLRGKILRITPQPDGSYTIPEGNLFSPGTPDTRPEIYVMGNRNPYRISIDQKTGYLYWGEVGPDAGEDNPDRGPRGHDEVNQARQAGNFGWPLFVGNNKAYNDYNFETGESGPRFDPAAPINDSPNNTGLRELPPAQEAFIWYPYAESPEFPIVGTGGRNAMAGPVFYSDQYQSGPNTFPADFDGRLFIYDWIRGWVLVVTMNEQGDLERIDPFMPSTRFKNPIDMQFDREGVMYIMEYGTGWFSQNADAAISRIEYNGGNLPPVVQMVADKEVGAAPLTVSFSSAETHDPEGDRLSYGWFIDESTEAVSTNPTLSHTFEDPGIHSVRLVVKDGAANEVVRRMDIKVGNEPPDVRLTLDGNSSFFFDDAAPAYEVTAVDMEDGSLSNGDLSPEEVFVQIDYLPLGYDQTIIAQGHQMANESSRFMQGKRLMDESDCSSCHQLDRASIGPTYRQVAEKYAEDEDARDYLSNKIKNGGGGVWGEQAMAAHPQLSDEELGAIVDYILSLTNENESIEGNLDVRGLLSTTAHLSQEQKEGMYFIRAAYTDRGANGISPITGQSIIVLRHPRLQAEAFDKSFNVGVPSNGLLVDLFDRSYIAFEKVDLTGITSLSTFIKAADEHSPGGLLEVRLGSPDGELLGSVTVPASALSESGGTFDMAIDDASGKHDVYLVFRSTTESVHPLFALDWLLFSR